MTTMNMTTLDRRPAKIVEKNIHLLGKLMDYLLANPQILDSLPADFELVILPEDDSTMRLYNLDLLDTYRSAEKPVVFVRMGSSHQVDFQQERPMLYVPLPA